jgi:hypothetical protein
MTSAIPFRERLSCTIPEACAATGLALQLPFMELSESMGNHDSKIVGADSVD